MSPCANSSPGADPMFLLIDAGNSRLKYGLHDGTEWVGQGNTAPENASIELPEGVRVARVVVANVAGDAMRAKLSARLAALQAPVEWLVPEAERCGLRNAYDTPAALGADRWAGAIAAWHRVHGECLVVSAGTATTIDHIAADGVFLGGCILPGLDTMLDSLVRNTAALPRSQGQVRMPPRNTHDAIATGCLLAQTGAIVRMAQGLGPAARVLLTGGHAETIRANLPLAAELHPGLVLDGLHIIAVDAHAAAKQGLVSEPPHGIIRPCN